MAYIRVARGQVSKAAAAKTREKRARAAELLADYYRVLIAPQGKSGKRPAKSGPAVKGLGVNFQGAAKVVLAQLGVPAEEHLLRWLMMDREEIVRRGGPQQAAEEAVARVMGTNARSIRKARLGHVRSGEELHWGAFAGPLSMLLAAAEVLAAVSVDKAPLVAVVRQIQSARSDKYAKVVPALQRMRAFAERTPAISDL